MHTSSLFSERLFGLLQHPGSLHTHIKRALGGVRGTKSIQVHLGRPGGRMFPCFLHYPALGRAFSSFSLSLPPSHTHTHRMLLSLCTHFLPRATPSPSIPLHIICDIITVSWSATLNGANRRRRLKLREEITKSGTVWGQDG